MLLFWTCAEEKSRRVATWRTAIAAAGVESAEITFPRLQYQHSPPPPARKLPRAHLYSTHPLRENAWPEPSAAV